MSGGSGCGCSATVFNSFVMEKLRKGEYKKVLYMPTGALMSTTATQQGESIPGICHALVIENDLSDEEVDTLKKSKSKNMKS